MMRQIQVLITETKHDIQCVPHACLICSHAVLDARKSCARSSKLQGSLLTVCYPACLNTSNNDSSKSNSNNNDKSVQHRSILTVCYLARLDTSHRKACVHHQSGCRYLGRYLLGPLPGVTCSPVAHAEQNGAPCLVEGIPHGTIPVHYPVTGRGMAVVILEEVHTQVCKVLCIQLFLASAAWQAEAGFAACVAVHPVLQP